MQARYRCLFFFFISTIFALTSFVMVPLEVISRFRHQRFLLRGFGFLCPLIACGAYALELYYSKRSLYHNRIALLINPHDHTHSSTNVGLIHDAALYHFKKLKSISNSPHLVAEALPLLIQLHFLQQHCRTLHFQWKLLTKEQIQAQKGKDRCYSSYRQLFEINADYLRANPEQKVELLQKNVVLVTTSQGKSLSIEEVFHQLKLELSSAVKKQSEDSCI